ncbi:DNA polymerase IV [Paenalkalicoccus suaedae]|uniref:DNA polymerase IV n=1 Tax=Paenalkalicoccus suaedae TaxID=2592382 RepID=A0A859FDR5_9BACI|nr:DNA polymerase IV [Paenalkalicoccus suaedae]QKS70991.1 DNA polymerase IV [Paenalkalicoccus suaedae]
MARIIFHVDMNSFYASVEVADDPSLRNKPLAIAGNAKQRRGIVVTASYEARAEGVKPPMPLWEALRHCRDLIVREPRFYRYKEKSQAMFAILREYTPLVEPVSIDEGYMDVTSVVEGVDAVALAEHIQTRLVKELSLPSSIGIAPNKFLAKMASDMKKPMGITVLRKRDLPTKMWPLKAIELHGIGKKTAERLEANGLHTIQDIVDSDPDELSRLFGVSGRRMHEKSRGIDHRPVDPDSIHHFKSIGHSTTLAKDAKDVATVLPIFRHMTEKVVTRLKQKKVYTQTIQITIRYSSFRTIQRSKQLAHATDDQAVIFNEAKRLFEEAWNGDAVRLVGVTAQELVPVGLARKQLNLFSYEEDSKAYEMEQLLSSLNKKFGSKAIRKGFVQEKEDL